MEYKKINKKIDITLKTELLKLDLYEVKSNSSQILLITINNLSSLNAINNEILDNLIDTFNYYIDNKIVRSIILTGAGDKAFIAGADIKTMSKYSPKEAYLYSLRGQKLISTILDSNKPVIAAVNGYALGGGCEIASACHLRYASSNAVFGQPEVKLGIIAGWGGTQNLPKIIGPANALELLVTGKTINSKRAYEIGLINQIIDTDLINYVLNVAVTINENSPNAIQNTLNSLNNSLNKNIKEGLDVEANLFKDSFNSKESQLGLNSFLKKEKPKF